MQRSTLGVCGCCPIQSHARRHGSTSLDKSTCPVDLDVLGLSRWDRHSRDPQAHLSAAGLSTAAGESSALSALCGLTAWLPVGERCPKQTAAASHQKATCDAAGIRLPVTASVRPMQTAIGGFH